MPLFPGFFVLFSQKPVSPGCEQLRVGGLTTGREVGENSPPLLLTRRQHRQDRLDEPTPTVTLRAMTALAPEHGMPQGAVELSEEIAPPAGLQNRACHFCGTRLLS